jgi:hypothetical protein
MFKSKHPGYNVMRAILETFKDPARNNRPQRPVLFFSEPEVDKHNYGVMDCLVPGNKDHPTVLNYKMYKLAESSDPNNVVAKGMVQFVQDAGGIRYLEPDATQWIELGK